MELLLGLYTLAFGLTLALPNDTLAASTSFRMLAEIAPESVWSGVVLLAGFGGVISLLYGRRVGRLTALMGTFAWWGFMSILAGLSSAWVSTGVGAFGLMSMASAWAYWRVSRGTA